MNRGETTHNDERAFAASLDILACEDKLGGRRKGLRFLLLQLAVRRETGLPHG